jgi:pimeloyl-ACP methyl ester carboxylesterase
MRAIVDQVDTTRSGLGYSSVTLLGVSYGGLVALANALCYPHCVDSLILCNAGPLPGVTDLCAAGATNSSFSLHLEERVRGELAEMALKELRQALQLTQQQLASQLELNQAAVSKMERQSDMYISTLRRFLNAMGAELKIIAHFPERDIEINQFQDMSDEDDMMLLKEHING